MTTDPIITICCVCHRVKSGETWVKQPLVGVLTISHGYCPDCYESTRKKIIEHWRHRS